MANNGCIEHHKMSRGRKKKMSDEELIKIIESHPDKAVTAGEITDKVDMTRAGVLERLNALSDEGAITKKKVGARAVVWWVPTNQASRSSSLP